MNKPYDQCFKYSENITSNHKEIRRKSTKNIKIELFIGRYNGDRINYILGVND